MLDRLEIHPAGRLQAEIRPPGSKSITNRALVCAALARGRSDLNGALDSEDTQVMSDSLRRLGLRVDHLPQQETITLDGCAGSLPVDRAELFVGNSGTTMRFLTALLAACRGEFQLDGIARMRERPIGDLLAALRQLGGDVASQMNNDCPPVRVRARGLHGGEAHVRGDISSQFLSGLLMACPYAERDVLLVVDGVLVSQPYVHMTLEVMSAFGVEVQGQELARFQIRAGQRYHGRTYEIEPDASAASYFWGAAAITGGCVTVRGLTPASLQGDVAFGEVLQQMGCRIDTSARGMTVTGGRLRGTDVDMNAISDTVPTLAAVALFAQGPTTIRGVAHIRHKETDRVGDLARELRKLGAEVEEREDGLRIEPGALRGALIETYNDHRLAMGLALAGLKIPGVVITNPACTSKTYPRFFDDLARICAE